MSVRSISESTQQPHTLRRSDVKNRISTPLVLGLGKVGYLVGLLLHETGFKVTGCDLMQAPGFPFPVRSLDVGDEAALSTALREHDAVISCLPYHLNLEIAKTAVKTNTHYFDLTEDVETTKAIMALSGASTSVLAPQCGLAPGFIGIVGAWLAEKFDRIRAIKLRVGALPKHPDRTARLCFQLVS